MTAPTIYPALFYADPGAAIDWLTQVLGFSELQVMAGPDGGIAHAELKFGDGVIMLGMAKPDRGWSAPTDLGGVNQVLYL